MHPDLTAALTPADDPAARVAAPADRVQEQVVEELWSLGRSTAWPPCPAHPDTHPAAAARRGDRAVWACPGTGAEIGEVGTLGG